MTPPQTAHFPTVTRELNIGGRAWRITAVENQDLLLDAVRTDHDVEYFPYGLLLWGSAVGLAEELAENPELVAGRRVLEIGCGVGLAGVVAASLGGIVTQTDYLPEALELSRANSAANGVSRIDLVQADWRSFPDLGPFDFVLGSDVLYERAMHPVLYDLLPRLLAPGGVLVVSDPMRPQALDFVQQRERDGWHVDISSRLVNFDGDLREIALFRARMGG